LHKHRNNPKYIFVKSHLINALFKHSCFLRRVKRHKKQEDKKSIIRLVLLR